MGQGKRFDFESLGLFISLIHLEEKLPLRVPQLFLEVPFERVGFRSVLICNRGVTSKFSHPRDGSRVSPEISVQRRPIPRRSAENIRGLTTVDVELHPIVMPRLPEQPDLRNEMPLLPALVVALQIRKQIDDVIPIGMNLMGRPDRIRKPSAVVPRLGA